MCILIVLVALVAESLSKEQNSSHIMNSDFSVWPVKLSRSFLSPFTGDLRRGRAVP